VFTATPDGVRHVPDVGSKTPHLELLVILAMGLSPGRHFRQAADKGEVLTQPSLQQRHIVPILDSRSVHADEVETTGHPTNQPTNRINPVRLPVPVAYQ
jgi:hypothetical protein